MELAVELDVDCVEAVEDDEDVVMVEVVVVEVQKYVPSGHPPQNTILSKVTVALPPAPAPSPLSLIPLRLLAKAPKSAESKRFHDPL